MASFTGESSDRLEEYVDLLLGQSIAILRSPQIERDWTSIASASEHVADALRDQTLRNQTGSDVLAKAVTLLLTESIKLIDVTGQAPMQLCRILGNLCIDHDENRQRLIDASAHTALALALCVGTSFNFDCIKAATGSLMNLCTDFPPAHVPFISSGVVEALVELLRSTDLYAIGNWRGEDVDSHAMVYSWAMRVIEEVVGSKQALPTHLPPILTEVLSHIILSSQSPASTAADADAEDLAEIDSEDVVISAELLEALALDESTSRQSLLALPAPSTVKTSPPLLLSALFDFVELSSTPSTWLVGERAKDRDRAFGNVKAAVCRAVVSAAGEDSIMVGCFGVESPWRWLVIRLIAWLDQERDQELTKTDLLVCASVVLANLARNDECSQTLVQDPEFSALVPALARILTLRTRPDRDRAKGKPGENSQVLHGVIGLLKHLAIPLSNKSILGRSDIIEPTASFLRQAFDVVQPLQTAAVGLLKHICSCNLDNTLIIVSAPSHPIDLVLGLCGRTDDVRLRNEATRILVNVIRALWSSRLATNAGDARAQAQADLADRPEVAELLATMIRLGERYPILINEGITSFALLSTSTAGALNAIKALLAAHELPSQVADQPTSYPALDGVAPSPISPNGLTNGTRPWVPNTATASSPPSRSNSLFQPAITPASARRGSLPPHSKAVVTVAHWISSKDLPTELRLNATSLVDAVLRSTPQTAPERGDFVHVVQPALQSGQGADGSSLSHAIKGALEVA